MAERAGASRLGTIERHILTGGDFLRRNRVEEARDELVRALALDSSNEKALGLLGLAYFRLSDFEGALPIYEQLVALDRNNASYWLNLGLVHLKLNDPVSAVAELSCSRDLDPSQSRAVSYLGLAHARNGQYDQAYLAFLQAGQTDLAREMEQYLSPEQRAEIQAAAAASTDASTDVELGDEDILESADDIHIDEADARPESGDPGADGPAGDVPPAAPYVGDEDELDYEAGVAAAAEDARVTAAVDRALADDTPDTEAEAAAAGAGAAEAAAGAEQPAAVPATTPPARAISEALARALPSAAAEVGAARVGMGHRPPQPLSEFATSRLLRPEEGDHTFEIGAHGVLIVRVSGRVYSRTEGVGVTGGELAYEVVSRRVRGSSSGEDFSSDGRPLFIVTGHGHLIASCLGGCFTAVSLDDDILYLRDDLVFAFEDRLSWENGHVPGSGGKIGMVQFRGEGSVAFRTARPLLAIKLPPERVLHVDAATLAGWIGRVVPRGVTPIGGGKKSTLFVECSGEGVILVEDSPVAPSGGRGGGQPARTPDS